MSSFDLINLMTLIQNLPLNFDVAFYNWLKILPPTVVYVQKLLFKKYMKNHNIYIYIYISIYILTK